MTVDMINKWEKVFEDTTRSLGHQKQRWAVRSWLLMVLGVMGGSPWAGEMNSSVEWCWKGSMSAITPRTRALRWDLQSCFVGSRAICGESPFAISRSFEVFWNSSLHVYPTVFWPVLKWWPPSAGALRLRVGRTFCHRLVLAAQPLL